jgi:hypothetical protein
MSSIFGHLGDPSKFIFVSVLGTISAEDLYFVDIEALRPTMIEKTKLLKPLTCNLKVGQQKLLFPRFPGSESEVLGEHNCVDIH